MRIWLNPISMAAYKIAPSDVLAALQTSNVQVQAGSVEGTFQTVSIGGDMALHSVDDFKHLSIKKQGQHAVTLDDIAKVELGVSGDGHQMVLFNGKEAIFAAVSAMPDANPLVVVKHVIKYLPDLQRSLPKGMAVHTVFDSTTYISSALHEVMMTLGIALVVVMAVILCCLGSFRAVLIPVVAIPLSLIGVCFWMYLLGFSLNLLTLLAMVLAIGLVVDDAIVVVENIHRHLEKGESPFDAAIKGAREIAGPIIVMTLTLSAVFAPIGFVSGITGALFREFAFALAGSVLISGVVALTLSPMLCMTMLSQKTLHTRFSRLVDRLFGRIQHVYAGMLHQVMHCRIQVALVALVIVINIAVFYMLTPKELAPPGAMAENTTNPWSSCGANSLGVSI
jgi:multidrug efflux pump